MRARQRIEFMSDPTRYREAFADAHRAEWWTVSFARAFVEHVDREWSSDPRRGVFLARVAHLIVIKAYRSVRRARGQRRETVKADWQALRVRSLGILGSVHRALGRLTASENAYRVAFEHAQGCPDVVVGELHRRRAVLMMELERWDDGFADLDLFESLVAVNPWEGEDAHAVASYYRGGAYSEMGDYVRAVQHMGKALNGFHPSMFMYKAALLNLAAYLAKGGGPIHKAMGYLRRAREQFKGLRDISLERAKLDQVDGLVHLALGMDGKAAKLLESARARLIKLGMALDVAAVSADLARIAVISSGETARSHERMRSRISRLMSTLLGLDGVPPRVVAAARAVQRIVHAPTVDLVDLTSHLRTLRHRATGPDVIPAFGW